jgi:transcriptional regulator with XRE-family HTH domain
MSNLKISFGRRVRTLRKRRGMTQEQLAEAADISVDFLSLMERGVNAPSFATLERLADALGVPVKELFDFSEMTRESI